MFGFLGPNGAGKTTAVKLLLGLTRPTGGTGTVLGRPLGDLGRPPADRLPPGAVPLPGLACAPARCSSSTRRSPACHGAPPRRDRPRPRAGRPGGPRRRPDRRLLEGHAAAPRARGRAPRRPRARDPRRADVRARPGRPRRRPRDHPRRPRARLGRAPQLAPAGRGGAALRPRRDRPPGPVVAAGTLARPAGRAGGAGSGSRTCRPRTATPLAAFGPRRTDDEGWLVVRPLDPERIPDVVAAVVAAGGRVHAVEPGRRSLEELFLGLVPRRPTRRPRRRAEPAREPAPRPRDRRPDPPRDRPPPGPVGPARALGRERRARGLGRRAPRDAGPRARASRSSRSGSASRRS